MIQQIEYELVELNELSIKEQNLLSLAFEATQDAYAPYSHFQVGCAILLADGEVCIGNNQENRAYPSGICAERTALFHIGALGKAADIRTMAIRARSEKFPTSQPITPCGACRQVMVEFEERCGKDVVVLMMGETGKVLKIKGVKKCLLPFSFEMDF
jgi:cytidine deaminase